MYCHIHSVILLFILVIVGRASSLRMVDMQVPHQALAGSSANLSCHWELGPREQLYSVKWFKEENEFFRYVPRTGRPEKFEVPGVTVEAFDIFEAKIRVVLSHVEPTTSGRYTCEVTGDAPTFRTVALDRFMDVAVPPQNGPIILAFRSKYRIGEKVEVKCKCGPSRPATHLTWYVNGKHTDSKERYNFDEGEMNISTINLNFSVETKHFKENELKIECLATLPSVYSESTEKVASEDKSAIGEMTRRATSKTEYTRSDAPKIITDFRIVVVICHVLFITMGRIS